MSEDRKTIVDAKRAVREMGGARNFPKNTCPASRHVAMMAATVEALWKARKKLAALGAGP